MQHQIITRYFERQGTKLPQRQGVNSTPDCLGVWPDEKTSSAQGLTLIECIVAIAVIGLTGVLITPPLFLAAATRVQNRRSEQALQIAQGEIDRIRTLVEQGEHENARIPQSVAAVEFPVGAPDNIDPSLRSVNAECNTYMGQNLPVTTLLPIDVNSDCTPDFYLQSFRTIGGQVVSDRPTDFDVGVRVYSRSIVNGGNLRAGIRTEQASLRFTSGEGNQRQLPLAALYTSATWDGSGVSLYCYHDPTDCSTEVPTTPAP